MAVKINKTNAARLLDKAKIAYELVPYEVDENNLAATHVAEQLGEDIAQVFKTLVLRGDKNGIFVCVIPGKCRNDSYERIVANYRVYPGRMFACRDEKAFSGFYSFQLYGIWIYLYQCRRTWATD